MNILSDIKHIAHSIREQIYFKATRNFRQIDGNEKIFCIGFNKTGTTSLKKAMEDLGYKIGNQREAEYFINDWYKGKFERIIKYCRTAEFFQDTPFSLSGTFKHLDDAFPGSKFILTVRDNSEQWYISITKFYSKLWGLAGELPTKADLLNAVYRKKGVPYHSLKKVFNTPDDDLFNREILIRCYENHNKSVQNYFQNRSEDLLVLNVAESNAFEKLCGFLKIESADKTFPWENKT